MEHKLASVLLDLSLEEAVDRVGWMTEDERAALAEIGRLAGRLDEVCVLLARDLDRKRAAAELDRRLAERRTQPLSDDELLGIVRRGGWPEFGFTDWELAVWRTLPAALRQHALDAGRAAAHHRWQEAWEHLPGGSPTLRAWQWGLLRQEVAGPGRSYAERSSHLIR
jgi:hypothetical protein